MMRNSVIYIVVFFAFQFDAIQISANNAIYANANNNDGNIKQVGLSYQKGFKMQPNETSPDTQQHIKV